MSLTKRPSIPMKGFISTALRNWFQNENGTYEEFKKKYALCRWIKTDFTKEMYEYIKTDPPRVYKSKFSDEVKKGSEKLVTDTGKQIQINGKRAYNRRVPYTPQGKQRLYKPIWTVDKKEIGKDGFSTLQLFIEKLVSLKKANFEIVEYVDNIVEVREYN